MRIFRRFGSYNLLAAWHDLRGFLKTRERYEYLSLVAALAITAFIIYGFWHDSYFPQQERIVYVQNWPASRTDAEIEADIKKDAAAKRAAEAQRRASYQRLANDWGIK